MDRSKVKLIFDEDPKRKSVDVGAVGANGVTFNEAVHLKVKRWIGASQSQFAQWRVE
jgi:hypothetical protein